MQLYRDNAKPAVDREFCAMPSSIRPQISLVERRKSERRATSLLAFAEQNNGTRFPCRIGNISDDGAMLEFLGSHVVLLSPTFDLALEEGGLRFSVKLIWRKGRTAGVLFCS
ncbi:PilZ domain-containing protein [Methylobacterium aerolatum]|uniref:PilZ domain-containing protein n=1 Tax=Methylobacterium aerolatum TaxID=418708 RepID=A0ABU0I5H5_9HYPH|nr:PilZ domain-containing protein [Methylobacterium aerolatum]MDQ0449872.1 hypothetical protein [Methylobacterium aerolatum]GJD36639.1 hypothetical protein FMGBMHLM_3562 [Methylobacterium aerolatum]